MCINTEYESSNDQGTENLKKTNQKMKNWSFARSYIYL